MDKIDQINEKLDALSKVDSLTQMHLIREIRKLISDCSDNSQVVIAYCRSQLDSALDTKSTDYQWQMCWEAIHGNDVAWSAMSDACTEAESDIGYMLDEEEMNNA